MYDGSAAPKLGKDSRSILRYKGGGDHNLCVYAEDHFKFDYEMENTIEENPMPIDTMFRSVYDTKFSFVTADPNPFSKKENDHYKVLRPRKYSSNGRTYYPLGDVFEKNGHLVQGSELVWGVDGQSVAAPIHANLDSVPLLRKGYYWSLRAPSGFNCPGMVATLSLDPPSAAELKGYRCVRDQFFRHPSAKIISIDELFSTSRFVSKHTSRMLLCFYPSQQLT